MNTKSLIGAMAMVATIMAGSCTKTPDTPPTPELVCDATIVKNSNGKVAIRQTNDASHRVTHYETNDSQERVASKVDVVYNTDGLASRMTTLNYDTLSGAVTLNNVAEITYNAAKKRLKTQNGNGTYTTYQYDANNRLTRSEDFTATAVGITYTLYEYVGNSNNVSRILKYQSSNNNAFNYFAFSYDASNNITSKKQYSSSGILVDEYTFASFDGKKGISVFKIPGVYDTGFSSSFDKIYSPQNPKDVTYKTFNVSGSVIINKAYSYAYEYNSSGNVTKTTITETGSPAKGQTLEYSCN